MVKSINRALVFPFSEQATATYLFHVAEWVI